MKTCTNCNKEFNGNYCNHCGQKSFDESHKSLKYIINEFFYGVTNFDKGFLKSLFTLIRRPGQMSLDYISGKQKTYFRPVSFFFVVVVIYMLSPYLKGMQPDFDNYRTTLFFKEAVKQTIENKIATDTISYEELRDQFNSKAEFTGKLSMLLLIPFAALLIFLFFYSRARPFYDSIILSIEINSYYLLVFFIMLPLLINILIALVMVAMDMVGYSFEQGGQASQYDGETLLTLLPFFLVVVWYFFTIFRRFFQAHWTWVLLKSTVFLFIFLLFTVTVYRYIVFELVLLQL